MHYILQREALRASLRCALAAYLAHASEGFPAAASVTADLFIGEDGYVLAAVTVADAHDVVLLGESL